MTEERQGTNRAIGPGLGPPWFGRLPRDWAVKPLGYLARFSSGGTPDIGKLEYWHGDVPWVSPKDMKRELIGDSEDHITELALRNAAVELLPPSTLLIVVRGMILAHTLPVAVTTAELTINQDIKALRCSPVIRPRFLQAVLQGQAHWILSLADQSAHGTKKLETEVLKQFEVPCPSPEVQDHVVAFLDREMNSIDALIAAKQRILDLLAEKRKAIIASAVTRGIDSNAKLRDSGVPWLGRVPAHWSMPRAGLAGAILMGRQRAPQYESGEHMMPYLRVANVFDGYIDYTDVLEMNFDPDEQVQFGLLPGDVLLNEGQSRELVGRSAIYEAEPGRYCFQNTLIRFRCHHGLLPRYAQLQFAAWGAAGAFEVYCRQTTNIAHLGAERLAQMPMLRPPIAEQQAIVDHIAREITQLDSVRSVTERTIALLNERRAALIAAAVTGQIDVGVAA